MSLISTRAEIIQLHFYLSEVFGICPNFSEVFGSQQHNRDLNLGHKPRKNSWEQLYEAVQRGI